MLSRNRSLASAVIGSVLALGTLIARPIPARAVDLDELMEISERHLNRAPSDWASVECRRDHGNGTAFPHQTRRRSIDV
jgi:hypothetical protein